ncbi:MAG: hypothetical protein Q9M22_01300 [Mariprofundaceae bacterium]|nr:hypothetical protein [Mariprofundaceae bacterium]
MLEKKKLYLKLERNTFYAMFGDYNTGLSITELGRYVRSMNGIKSEFKGSNYGYTAFASRTSQSYIKDELRGNGFNARDFATAGYTTRGVYVDFRMKLDQNNIQRWLGGNANK